MRREICIRQVRKWTVSIYLHYPIMVVMSFCSSSVIFSFKVRYCGKREIFLRFCGITYPPKDITLQKDITLHYVTLHYITLHYITLHYITLHYITLHYITLHYITLHYITLHYITLHYITLHYITLHYITLHYRRTVQLLFIQRIRKYL